MQPDLALLVSLLATGQSVNALALPPSIDAALEHLSARLHPERDINTDNEELWKRKGGGGGGGRGGSSGGSSSSGGRGSSSGSSSSGSGGSRGSGSSSSGSGSSGSSGGRGSSSSSSGGATRTGSGPRPAYGGGAYYGGGAKQPFKAGGRSPLGIAPFLLAGGALGFLSYAWIGGAYNYPYNRAYPYYNSTEGRNETKPVSCLCDPYQVCGCDDNGNMTYWNSIIGDGSYNQLNKTLLDVGDVNGTSHIFINGTLPNGTTASGGDEDADGGDSGGSSNEDTPSGAAKALLVQAAGWWPVVTTAAALAFMV